MFFVIGLLLNWLWPPTLSGQPPAISPILPGHQNHDFAEWQCTQSQGENHNLFKLIPVISQSFENGYGKGGSMQVQ